MQQDDSHPPSPSWPSPPPPQTSWSDEQQQSNLSPHAEEGHGNAMSNGDGNLDIPAPPLSPPPARVEDEEEGEVLSSNGAPLSPFTASMTTAHLPPLPHREEPTLKEKLVERERQARVETERARLIRQFALRSNEEDDVHGDEEGSASSNEREHDSLRDISIKEGHGSVTGTLGEGSSVAEEVPPTSTITKTDEQQLNEKLGYAMERFLSEQAAAGVDNVDQQKEQERIEQGVVMERFLAEPMIVEHQVHNDQAAAAGQQMTMRDEASSESEEENSKIPAVEEFRPANHLRFDETVNFHRTGLPVSDSMEVNADDTATQDGSDVQATLGSIRSYSTVSNDGMSVADRNFDIMPTTTEDEMLSEPGVDDDIPASGLREPDSPARTQSSLPSQTSPSNGPTRVLRLTEAEIQEMAAIEEASIGNAPPSEREESVSSSLVGDMIREFDNGSAHGGLGTFSERTHTTAVESASSVGGDPIAIPLDHGSVEHSIDAIEATSSSSQRAASPSASHDEASVTAMPPSDIANDEPPPSTLVLQDDDLDVALRASSESMNDEDSFPTAASRLGVAPSFEDSKGNLDAEACAAANVGVENRAMRPGKLPPSVKKTPVRPPKSEISDSKRAMSLPARLMNVNIEDFDFDKNWADTPRSTGQDSFNELPSPSSQWSNDNAATFSPERSNVDDRIVDRVLLQEQLQCPKLDEPALAVGAQGNGPRRRLDLNQLLDYGATASASLNRSPLEESHLSIEYGGGKDEETPHHDEAQPLLRLGHEVLVGDRAGIQQSIQDAFDDVHTESTDSVDSDVDDCEKYLKSSILERAFPERMFALLVTLIVEIPVLLMVSGGSDRLCQILGRRRYMLLMGFLPLSSAISGNVGLQASTLTTRAISHFHVTVETYPVWLRTEIGAAAYLGTGMGLVIGGCAFFISEFDFAFGFTVFMAQFVSILTAGVTGTLAPLMFTFIFRRDSGKWGGPLETAVQDIVGSFAMVVMSYHLLLMFPLRDIAEDDMCGIASPSSDP